ncbi:hypothetical protein [Chitinophaga nivalis]|uniref:Bacteriocin n=1 Tax=Chitinophaga nivalis TaxID=2991709 RepID=A0ABT3IES7_9BACT|nr:hypothetical protein [Chitinophaga nivalis]MCW3467846.1 hypothetical protein [Chitinophaga nivalis]MCW3482462.1 hypothetical protein [Chitinophaga nivalis]
MKQPSWGAKKLTRKAMSIINGGQSNMRQICAGGCNTDMNCRNIAGAACRCHAFGCKWG